MINIGFNVQTDKAVKSLNDLEKRLKDELWVTVEVI